MEEVRDKDDVALNHMASREVNRPTEEPQKTPCVDSQQQKNLKLLDCFIRLWEDAER